jgi:hypothetical protein
MRADLYLGVFGHLRTPSLLRYNHGLKEGRGHTRSVADKPKAYEVMSLFVQQKMFSSKA